MDVIGHDHEGVKKIMPEFLGVVSNSLNNHISDIWLAQVDCSVSSLVQQPIHRRERLLEFSAELGKAR
jgi:hypothetical protein